MLATTTSITRKKPAISKERVHPSKTVSDRAIGKNAPIVEVGLVRLHLMELSGGDFLPTGRVVAFSNSIVFQPTAAGMFRQIPGTNFRWHEITLELSLDVDYAEVKRRLLAVVEKVLANYRDDLDRQYRVLQNSFIFVPVGEFHPRVQLHFLPFVLQVVVRFQSTGGRLPKLMNA